MNKTIVVTGCAGFIGAKVSSRLLEKNHTVIGIDNLNNYYSVNLKLARLETIKCHENFKFYQVDIKSAADVNEIFRQHKPSIVIHLAAQAGVRYSIENPHVYIDSNLIGFANMLEACRQFPVEHLVFASSSSVYGNDTPQPFSITAPTDKPVSLYAATKKANEVMAHSYSHLYQIPMTGLRYFTVYGPWGRPDMAPIKFTQQIVNQQTIRVFNQGHHKRDFTYIDDIVDGTLAVVEKNSAEPYRLFNIASGKPIELLEFITTLEEALGMKAILDFVPKQPGDVDETWADISDLTNAVGYRPKIGFAEGIGELVKWFRESGRQLLD